MPTRIIINGHEITNPVIKVLMILGVIIISAMITAIVIFVLLPIIGIAVTLSASFLVIFIVATIISVATLSLVTVISAWLFGGAEFRIERIHKRK